MRVVDRSISEGAGMLTFTDVVALAAAQEPVMKIRNSATAFLSLSGFNALIVTATSPESKTHKVLYSSGYPQECVDHVCSAFVVNDPYFAQLRAVNKPFDEWTPVFMNGFQARTWLIPAGYRNGSSVSLQDQNGRELGSIHVNTRLETLSDQQFEAIDSLTSFLKDAISTQIEIDRLGLTQREVEVIRFVVQGASNPDIADVLHISKRTVATHIENVLRKLDAHSRVEIAVRALRLGLA